MQTLLLWVRSWTKNPLENVVLASIENWEQAWVFLVVVAPWYSPAARFCFPVWVKRTLHLNLQAKQCAFAIQPQPPQDRNPRLSVGTSLWQNRFQSSWVHHLLPHPASPPCPSCLFQRLLPPHLHCFSSWWIRPSQEGFRKERNRKDYISEEVVEVKIKL